MSTPLPTVRAVRLSSNNPDGHSMKLERRREVRDYTTGSVAATYSNGRDRFGLTYLDLVDCSSSGLGAVSRTRIEPGMIVTMCPEGSTIPWRAAKAVRCERAGDEFRIGLRLSCLAAA